MSNYRISIEFADVSADNYPELQIEVLDPAQKDYRDQIVHAVTVSSSKKDGHYDTVDVNTDTDEDGDFDDEDKDRLLSFADTAIRLLKQ